MNFCSIPKFDRIYARQGHIKVGQSDTPEANERKRTVRRFVLNCNWVFDEVRKLDSVHVTGDEQNQFHGRGISGRTCI